VKGRCGKQAEDDTTSACFNRELLKIKVAKPKNDVFLSSLF